MEMSLGFWAADLLISQLTGRQLASHMRKLPWEKTLWPQLRHHHACMESRMPSLSLSLTGQNK